MPLKTLIVIALRLYTIYWLVEGVAALLVAAPFLFSMKAQAPGPIYPYFFAPMGMLLAAGILWISAFRLSSKVTDGHETQLAFAALTRRDLYCFAFVFLGLFFGLSSIYSCVVAGYKFFTFDVPQPDGSPERGRYLWPFAGYAFTMIAGFTCVFGAEKLATKLIRQENKAEAVSSSV